MFRHGNLLYMVSPHFKMPGRLLPSYMYDMEIKMTLENVKIGDLLYIPHTFSSGGTLETVTRITATQVLTEKDKRYKKSSGKRYGSYSSTYAYVALQSHINQVKHAELANKLSRQMWREFTLEKLQKIVDIVEEESI